MDPKYKLPCPEEIAALAAEANSRIKQKEHEEAYQKSVEEVFNQLREREAHDMSETLKSQIRQWFYECRWDAAMMEEYFQGLEEYLRSEWSFIWSILQERYRNVPRISKRRGWRLFPHLCWKESLSGRTRLHFKVWDTASILLFILGACGVF